MDDERIRASEAVVEVRIEVARHIYSTLVSTQMMETFNSLIKEIRPLCEVSLDFLDGDLDFIKEPIAKEISQSLCRTFGVILNRDFVEMRIQPVWMQVYTTNSPTELSYMLERMRSEIDINYFFPKA